MESFARYTRGMTEKNQKSEAGSIALAIGTGVALLSVFIIATQITGVADFMAWPWVGATIGLALVVVGYLQKIAAK